MALRKRKTQLTELFAEREALRTKPIKKDPRILAFIEVEKSKNLIFKKSQSGK